MVACGGTQETDREVHDMRKLSNNLDGGDNIDVSILTNMSWEKDK